MTDLNALHDEMVDLNTKIKALQDQAAKTSQEVFKASLTKFFDAVPEIKQIFWRQYTPHWNDGDTCEFSVGDVNFYTTDDRDEEDDENGWDGFDPFAKPSSYVYEGAANKDSKYWTDYQETIDKYETRIAPYTPERIVEIQRAIKDVKDMFRTINDDYFLMMFGDHVEVTATRDGFQVDEFDHD